MSDAFRDGRWGVRQLKDGRPTSGGTVGMGWATAEDAEAANPAKGPYSYEVFDRFGAESDS